MHVPKTQIRRKNIKRVLIPEDGTFTAPVTLEKGSELAVEFAPGVPTDPDAFREWVKAENARLNPVTT
jgi:hypothetical protein